MAQIEIVSCSQKEKWDNLVKSFKEYDVYYLQGYAKGFQIHGDGDPTLVYYEASTLRGIGVFVKRDIGALDFYKGIIPTNIYFDLVTPYGYGGFLFEGEIVKDTIVDFNNYYMESLKRMGVVCEFVRYHPLLKNAQHMRDVSTVIDLGVTVEMDISNKELIWENITSKNRNVIRKAEKNGVKVYHERSLSVLKEFKDIYNLTMLHDSAEAYYFFQDDFYNSIYSDLADNFEVFYAMYNDKMIAASIILFANNKMHYHLSGSRYEYRCLAPTNLLLYTAACWGNEMGFHSFHLGGGLGSGSDSLYKFKKAFNRHSTNSFSIGKRIVDTEIYTELLKKREDVKPLENKNSSYFPLYRDK